MNPHTATDAEVDEWLAVHCMGWEKGAGAEAWYLETGLDPAPATGITWCPIKRVQDWHPTTNYNDLRLCEEKVQGRWRMVLRRLSNSNWYAETDRTQKKWFIHTKLELSARARLIMAVLQEESRG